MQSTSRARFRRNRLSLMELKRTKNKEKIKKILELGGKDLTNCICECAMNVIKGNVPLTKAQFKQMKRYKTSLQQLSNKKISQRKRNTIVNQKGAGLLPLLIGPIIKALAGSIL